MNVLYFPLAFVITLLIVPIFRKLALMFNIVDNPNARKVHQTAKPYLGGLAVFVSIVLSLSFYSGLNFNTEAIQLTIIAALVMVLGTVDDIIDMPSLVKLAGQLILAFIAATVIGGIAKVEIYSFTIFFTKAQGIFLVTIWIVALINAFNLIDGLDGLATGTAIISFSTILIMSFLSNDLSNTVLLLVIIGCLFGFLFYNFYPSTIFLGDSGSMLIGYAIAILSITNYKTVTATSMILLLLIGFLPILDTILSFIRRKVNGERAFKADSLHFHHRLLLHGYSHQVAVLIMYGFMILYAIIALLISFTNKFSVKLGLFLSLLCLTIFIIERFYLLSNKYTFFSNALNKIFKRNK